MAAVMDILIQARDMASDVFNRVGNSGEQAGEMIAGAMRDAERTIDNASDGASDSIRDISRAAQDSEESLDELGEAAKDVADDMENLAEEQKQAFTDATTAIGATGAALTAFAQAQKDVNSRMDKFAYLTGMSDSNVSKLVQSISDANFGVEETITVLERGRKEGLKSEEQLKKYADGWKTVQKATGAEVDELMEFSPILDRANASLADGTKAMDAFGWVVQNTTSSVPEFMDAVAGSMVDIGDAEIKLNEMAAALKIVEDIYGVTGPEAIAVFQAKIGEAAGAVDENGNELGWSMETFAQAIGTTTEEINKLASGVEGSAKVMEDLAGIQDENATLFDKLMAKIGDFTTQHSAAIQTAGTFGTIMSGLTPIILLVANANAIYTTITTAAAGATTFFAGALAVLTSPITLVIAAILAIIAVVYLLIKHWDKVREFGIKVWEGIATAAEKAWELLKQGAEIAFKAIFWHWITLYNGIKMGIEFIADVFPKVWEKVKEVSANVWDFLISLPKKWYEGVVSMMTKAVDFIKGIWSSVGDFFKGLWDGIINGIKAPINLAIDGVNALINGLNSINIKIPNWIPVIGGKEFGFSVPNIPRLHTGGIFNAPAGQSEGLALLKQGEMVLDPMASRNRLRDSNDEKPYEFKVYLDGKKIAQASGPHLVKSIVVKGG